jgi:hypothetical protein
MILTWKTPDTIILGSYRGSVEGGIDNSYDRESDYGDGHEDSGRARKEGKFGDPFASGATCSF